MMRKSTILRVEDILRDYPKLERYIAQRIEDLKHPVYERDENVGGGRAENKRRNPVLDMLITIDEDERINALKRQKRAIAECLDESDQLTQVLIEDYYFYNRKRLSLSGVIAEKQLAVSSRTAFRLRHDFICRLAHKLGMYDPD